MQVQPEFLKFIKEEMEVDGIFYDTQENFTDLEDIQDLAVKVLCKPGGNIIGFILSLCSSRVKCSLLTHWKR